MQIIATDIPDVLLLQPTVFTDERGYFLQSFQQQQYELLLGRSLNFVQDNHSHSKAGVLRGLHYQLAQPQAKLIRVVQGEVFDVAVDLRRSSKTFGHWVGHLLSAKNQQQLWIPEGFAHGFLVLSDSADVHYKTTDYYAPAAERSIRFDDPQLGIAWPLQGAPLLSPKDAKAPAFADAEYFS
ncbi:dTDP-4-dehydrorhamnose 3,5-epimerase [Rheinheimera sp.]|uniref:dTDP-4-dehydrorhamnose 3,5-epimerase n=1 Tax=Rheinheimera sp. TaxID=1869214 RepID=UPI0027BAFB98|nr:dTDP-4-dehydrorhamnose 3,5-epimerase [Rheinheimera sp.]